MELAAALRDDGGVSKAGAESSCLGGDPFSSSAAMDFLWPKSTMRLSFHHYLKGQLLLYVSLREGVYPRYHLGLLAEQIVASFED